jgi:hypothetical protein
MSKGFNDEMPKKAEQVRGMFGRGMFLFLCRTFLCPCLWPECFVILQKRDKSSRRNSSESN